MRDWKQFRLATGAVVVGALILAFAAMRFPPVASPDGEAANSQDSRIVRSQVPKQIPVSRPPPCPPEELSCGLQKPVVSDGVHPFVNEEMGLRVMFPRGSQVCLTRSGDAARGFYTSLEPVEGCPERPNRRFFISINTMWNATFHPSAVDYWEGCLPPSGAVRQRLMSGELSFPGHRSMTCQETSDDGMIVLSVNALAREHSGEDLPPEFRTPSTAYSATLGTTLKRLDEDLPRFRRILRSIRIQ
jgi:hypothetical protein